MIQLDSVILPDVLWPDRYQFTGVDSRMEKTLTGRPIVWEQSTQGRPITLAGGADFAWIEKSDLVDLLALAFVPNATYELSYEGELHTVRFRHEDSPCIEATPVLGRPNEASTDYYCNLTIKLMEV